MRASEAGEISDSGYCIRTRPETRQPRRRAPLLRQHVGRKLDLARRRRRHDIVEQRERPALRVRHPQGRRVGISLGRMPRIRASAPSTASSISSWSLALKHFLGEAEARRESAEDLGVGQRLAGRRDHRLGALQPMVAVCGIEIVRIRNASRPAARCRTAACSPSWRSRCRRGTRPRAQARASSGSGPDAPRSGCGCR